ncbi:HyuA N-methylhydantoinase A/acetone carboxylase, beta subunit [Rhabdaerophilaceae bacterium]
MRSGSSLFHAQSSAQSGIRIAIDIGGTFTDLEYVDLATGRSQSFKVPTTPHDFSIGFMNAVTGAGERFGFSVADIKLVIHGTTIATNAVLTRNLPDGALITTAGFEDVLEIGRHARKDVYALKPERRSLLVPRRRRFGVIERMGATGEIICPIDAGSLNACTTALAKSGASVVAICLLNAYLNPIHEIAIRRHIMQDLPAVRVSCSHEVSPEIREFERSSTTVLNALLMPIVQNYVEQLQARMQQAGLTAPLYLVQSNGGATTPAAAVLAPVKLLLSGPSGGVLAAERLAEQLSITHAVGVDMGGTSYDVALIQNGRRTVVAQGEVDGLPVRVPMVEMRTIGAGGGSIVKVDATGRLQVGPESASAAPGPVCYRRGGQEPTTTDANVVLGRLDAASFMRGSFPLDENAARAAIETRVARPLAIGVEEAAEGVIGLVTAKLAGAIKLSLFERGLDPRDFALMSFGGAGGVHAVEVAEELGMRTVVFPRNPSTFSAHGILQSDIAYDLARTQITQLKPESADCLNAIVAELAQAGHRLMAMNANSDHDVSLRFAADLRYRGQAFELMLPLVGETIDPTGVAALVERFHHAHLERFSFDDRQQPVEMVTMRLVASCGLGGVIAPAAMDVKAGTAPSSRPVYLRGRWQDVLVHQQESLPHSSRLEGPAVIEQDYTSLLLMEGWHLTVTENGDLVARRDGEIQ